MSAIVHVGNVLDILPTLEAVSVNCVVTSPPYWGLRDYGVDGQLGLEATPELYVANMVAMFREVRRILRDDGTLWLNLGDSYAGGGRGGNPDESPFRKQATNTGSVTGRAKEPGVVPAGLKPKDLCMIPARVAMALQADGWWLRSDIIWDKKACMPESVRDRCTSSHEYLFMLTKSARYWYDAEAVREPDDGKDHGRMVLGGPSLEPSGGLRPAHSGIRTPGGRNGSGRNKRDVWTIAPQPFAGAHFATYPEKLVEPCVLAGCPAGGTVLDPFTGSGTTGAVACRLGRDFVGIELSPEYAEMAERRIAPHRDQMQLAVTT